MQATSLAPCPAWKCSVRGAQANLNLFLREPLLLVKPCAQRQYCMALWTLAGN